MPSVSAPLPITQLQALAPNLWRVVHAFSASGLPCTTRMTVVRLTEGHLWLHSPVPIGAALKDELQALGSVRRIVAPSKAHHLFAGECHARTRHGGCAGQRSAHSAMAFYPRVGGAQQRDRDGCSGGSRAGISVLTGCAVEGSGVLTAAPFVNQ